jgi:hypothetical protein
MDKRESKESPEAFFAEFSDRELHWMQQLSTLSEQQTSLKALKKMNRRIDMPTYCNSNIHMLPSQRRTDWLDLQIANLRNKKYLALPGAVCGSVGLR